MTNRDRKITAIALAVAAAATLVFTVLYGAGVIEGPAPVLILTGAAVIVIPVAVRAARRHPRR